jgi:hypothetical protein
VLDHSCQVQRHRHSERGSDLYETPTVAVEALLRVEKLPALVWEPAAGKGAIVRVLRDAGHGVIATDVHDHGFHLSRVTDFLTEERIPTGCGCICTNPPYQWAEQFVAHALELLPIVIMLLRLAFLESERRCGILEGRGLARVHVFRKRLPMMHRDEWAGRAKPTPEWPSPGSFGIAITPDRLPLTGSRGSAESWANSDGRSLVSRPASVPTRARLNSLSR